mgnify:CR=1 FL=1
MKFLVDAQLPMGLTRFLQASGYDTIHTLDLPDQNYTSDTKINEISIKQERIVITKDSDFVDSLLTIQRPYKLLLITTGNIKNSVLKEIIASQLPRLVDLFKQYKYIELSRDSIIVHY